LKHFGLGEDQIEKLGKRSLEELWFKPPQVSIGVSGPFVKLFEKAKPASEAGEVFTKGIAKDASLHAKTFDKLGKVFQFGSRSFKDIPIKEETLVGIERIKSHALNELDRISALTDLAIEGIEAVPIVGKPAVFTGKAVGQIAKLPIELAKVFKKTFMERTVIGKEFLSINKEMEDSVTSQIVEAKRLSSLNEKQKQVLEEQAVVYQQLDKKVEENIIKGCQSRVWLAADLEDGKINYTADSDAIITKGIISLMIRVLTNKSPKEIAEADLFFIDEVGLKEHLSPTRSNGLVSMVKQV